MRSFVRLHFGPSVALATGVLAGLVLLSGDFSAGRLLVVWNLSALAYLGVAWHRMMTATLGDLRRRAAELDVSDSVILILSVAAALASLAGIGFELSGIRDSGVDVKLAGAGLAMATVVISWTVLHTLFTLHYAHSYDSAAGGFGGLRCPEKDAEPVYWDFLYFSFTIGVAAQTADVSITSMPMRRLVLAHAILSFFFNTTILALAVNAGASLM